MLPTKNDLSEQDRTEIIELLNARLADAIDLHYQAKQAHWNVRGKDFFQLHELFDKVAHDIRKHVDEIAERAAQLGGSVKGTIRMAAERTTLEEYPEEIFDGPEHVEALSSALSAFGAATRRAIDVTSDLGDMATADLFTQVTRTADELLWMVEAHLHGRAGAEAEVAAPQVGAPTWDDGAEQAARQRH